MAYGYIGEGDSEILREVDERVDSHKSIPPSEPLVRASNVFSLVGSTLFFFVGWKKLAGLTLVLNGLDVVARQVSPDYRKAVNKYSPLAGLGFVPAIRNLQ